MLARTCIQCGLALRAGHMVRLFSSGSLALTNCADLVYAFPSTWMTAPNPGAEAKDDKDSKDSKDSKTDAKDSKDAKDAPPKSLVINAAIGFSRGIEWTDNDFSFGVDALSGALYCTTDDYKNPLFRV